VKAPPTEANAPPTEAKVPPTEAKAPSTVAKAPHSQPKAPPTLLTSSTYKFLRSSNVYTMSRHPQNPPNYAPSARLPSSSPDEYTLTRLALRSHPASLKTSNS